MTHIHKYRCFGCLAQLPVRLNPMIHWLNHVKSLLSHRIHVWYANIWGILMGSMLPYTAAPWVLWDIKNHMVSVDALGIIIPTDELIFFRGVGGSTTNQKTHMVSVDCADAVQPIHWMSGSQVPSQTPRRWPPKRWKWPLRRISSLAPWHSGGSVGKSMVNHW